MVKPDLEVLIESLLFFKGGALSVKELAKAAESTEAEIKSALVGLKASLEGRGIRLVEEGNSVMLTTASESHEVVEKMRREELEGPLGKAGLETLAIIMYRGPLSRSSIEYVRGVNCSSILRTLMIRGLIERIENPSDRRGFLYRPTIDLPAYLGVNSLVELPEFENTKAAIEKIFEERERTEAGSPETEERENHV